MKRHLLIIFVSVLTIFISWSAYPWSGNTHKTITRQVEGQYQILNSYLKNIGFSGGAEKTKFTLRQQSGYYTPAEIGNVYIWPWELNIEKTALQWLIDGSYLEDGLAVGNTPLSFRAFKHFHDPTG